MFILSQDLIAEILSWLPVKCLIRFQCVSKAWFALIKDPNFIRMHLENNRERSLLVETKTICLYFLGRLNFSNEYRFGESVKIFPPFNFIHKPADTSVVGCCNGLVCIQTEGFKVVIWNPSIKKYKKLPFEPLDDEQKLQTHSPAFKFAFGYDPVHNDYKVIWIVKFLEDGHFPNGVGVKVYSLKAHSWTIVEGEWYDKESFNYVHRPAFTNSACHWTLVASESNWSTETSHI
jgi:hypothetical protein